MSEGHKTPGFPPRAGEMSEGQRGIAGRQTPTIPVHTGFAKVPRGGNVRRTKGATGRDRSVPGPPLRFSVSGREQAKRCERGMQGTRGQTDSSQKPPLLQTPAYPNHHAIYHEQTPSPGVRGQGRKGGGSPFRGERGASAASGVCRGGARRTPPSTTALRKETATRRGRS